MERTVPAPATSPPAHPLRVVRADHVLSMRELADAAGVSSSTIALTEAGQTTPRPASMRRIARALGVHPQSIAEFRRALEARARRRAG